MEYIIKKDELGIDVITFAADTLLELMKVIDKYVSENDISNMTEYAKTTRVGPKKVVLIPEMNSYNGKFWTSSYALNIT